LLLQNVISTNGARQWFDERRVFEPNVIRYCQAVSARDGNEFGSAALYGYTNRAPSFAEIVSSATTLIAIETVQRGVDDNSITGVPIFDRLPNSDDFASKFMAWNYWIRRREFSPRDVEICSTNPAGCNRDDYLVGTWSWIVNGFNGDVSLLADKGGPHFVLTGRAKAP
jgi:hypothetical protein